MYFELFDVEAYTLGYMYISYTTYETVKERSEIYICIANFIIV